MKALALFAILLTSVIAFSAEPDLILHHGKIVTVDGAFSIQEAIAVSGGKITAVGKNQDVVGLKGAQTRVIDLGGKMILPGLIDSHVHPEAAMTEFDHPIPEMESINDVLEYVRKRASELQAGDWVQVRQVFITRLREQRYPTLAELDQAAPLNPVIFATGPGTRELSRSPGATGIDMGSGGSGTDLE